MSFQGRTYRWTEHCFGKEIADDKIERNYRFTEEALELVQSAGIEKEKVLELVEYVFSRPVGEIKQEVGGVMVTLAAFCNANRINLEDEANNELQRCWNNIEKIRHKQANKKIKNGPLP